MNTNLPENSAGCPSELQNSVSQAEAPLSFARKRPAVLILLAVAAGVSLGQITIISHWLWGSLALVCLLAAGAKTLKRSTQLTMALVALGLVTLFAFRVAYLERANPENHVRRLVDDGRRHTIYGYVNDWPDIREQSTRLTITVDSIDFGGEVRSVRGGILLNIAVPTSEFQYADRLVLQGEITGISERRNPAGFDYARYLRQRDVFGVVYLAHPFHIQRNPQGTFSVGGLVERIRGFILNTFRDNLGEAEAALSSGFLIGETSGISEEIYRLFRDTGTLHLLAVSGSNVAIALLAVWLVLWPFPIGRRNLSMFLIAGAALFAFVSHNEPSVIRASVVISLFLLGRLLQRRVDYHNLLASAGVLILAWDPNQLFDVGFQLSFVVAWVLVISVDGLREMVGQKRTTWKFRYLLAPLTVAFFAQLAAAPLTLFYFGSAPLWGTVANLVVTPLVSLAVFLSLLTLIATLILPALGAFVGSLLNILLGWTLTTLRFFGDTSAAQLDVPGLSPLLTVFLVAIVFLLAGSLFRTAARRTLVTVVLVMPVLLAGWRLSASDNQESSIWLYATSGGILALVEDSAPTLLLADLRGSAAGHYAYTLKPHIRKLGLDGPANIALLSSDYTTLETANLLLDSLPASSLIITSAARGLARDLELLPDSAQSGVVFSSALSREEWDRALSGAHSDSNSDSPVNSLANKSLIVGRSLACLKAGDLLALFLADETSPGEIRLALSAISEFTPANRQLFVICPRVTPSLAKILQDELSSSEFEVYAQSRSGLVRLSPELSRRVRYLTETGAIRLIPIAAETR